MDNNVSSIYLSSFNMNGAGLSEHDARQWLLRSNPSKSAHDADFVILSLQECPTYPDISLSSESFPYVAVLGPPLIDEKKDHDELPSIIRTILSDDHILVADIAMGEPATCTVAKVTNATSDSLDKKKNQQSEKYYGFIRLIIYAKNALASHILSSAHKHNGQSIVPILSPSGRKKTSTYDKIYEKPNSSPDKGGVCIAIPSLQLLIYSLHLCGTNKYHTLESTFDVIRIEELRSIGQTCSDELLPKNTENASTSENNVTSSAQMQIPSYKSYKKIILGDLNFRVEVCVNEMDKGRGGQDFQLVMNVIKSQSKERLNDLFWNCDHLVSLLNDIQPQSDLSHNMIDTRKREEVKDREYNKISILENVVDVYMKHFPNKPGRNDSNAMDILPTFTFVVCEEQVNNKSPHDEISQPISRLYSDKRTPSWPDRILVDEQILNKEKNGRYEIVWLESNQNVSISDHVPVCCFLQQINGEQDKKTNIKDCH